MHPISIRETKSYSFDFLVEYSTIKFTSLFLTQIQGLYLFLHNKGTDSIKSWYKNHKSWCSKLAQPNPSIFKYIYEYIYILLYYHLKQCFKFKQVYIHNMNSIRRCYKKSFSSEAVKILPSKIYHNEFEVEMMKFLMCFFFVFAAVDPWYLVTSVFKSASLTPFKRLKSANDMTPFSI